MFKLRILCLLVSISVMLLCSCNQPAQTRDAAATQEPLPDFSHAAQISGTYDAGSKILTVEIILAEGMHAYAPGESVGKPVSLNVTGKNGWKIDGLVDTPKGTEKRLETNERSILLTDRFALRARVVGGSGDIEAILQLQVCSSKFCDRPRTHTLNIETLNKKTP